MMKFSSTFIALRAFDSVVYLNFDKGETTMSEERMTMEKINLIVIDENLKLLCFVVFGVLQIDPKVEIIDLLSFVWWRQFNFQSKKYYAKNTDEIAQELRCSNQGTNKFASRIKLNST